MAGEGEFAPGTQVGQVCLRSVNLEPKAAWVGYDEERRSDLRHVGEHLVRTDLLAGRYVAFDKYTVDWAGKKKDSIGAGTCCAIDGQPVFGSVFFGLCAGKIGLRIVEVFARCGAMLEKVADAVQVTFGTE